MNATFRHRLEVRFRDCDAMGHVNNAVYLTYLEEARFAHWRALALADLLPDDGSAAPAGAAVPGIPAVILARAEIDYRRPATFGDTLEVLLRIAEFGRTSFTYEYEILDRSGAAVAAARTVLVRFDYGAGRPIPLTPALKEALGRNLL